jgi:hypothetical protein
MLKIIGTGRLIKFTALVVLAIGAWSYGLMTLGNQLEKAKLNFREEQNKSEAYQADIKKLNNVAKLMEIRENDYSQITNKGVSDVQDRIVARRVIQDVRLRTDIPFLTYRISQEKTEPDPFINQQGYEISKSEIFFQINAYTGKDIFNFIETLKRDFDGHIVLEDVQIEKTESGQGGANVTIRSTSALAQTLVTPRLEAKVTFTWNSLRPSQAEAATEEFMDF